MKSWEGGRSNPDPAEDESWSVEIDHDCFSEDEPFVVCVVTKDADGEAMACPSAEQAREMAASLIAYADMTDAANERVAKWKATRAVEVESA